MSAAHAFDRLLLTGAAGGIGREMRPRLRALARILRVSDIAPLGAAAAGEELAPCDLADRDAVHGLLAGVDAVVHLGGVSVERPYLEILGPNIAGLAHLYEAARIHGVRRIVFASSNHVIGFYPRSRTIDADDPPRPDSFYGVSKAFGENLSRFYYDRYGLETVCVRIGSCFPEPRDRRMLATWISIDDLTELVRLGLTVPSVGHTIVFGASDNRDKWWDNSAAAHLGFVPRESSEKFRAAVEARSPAGDPATRAARMQGGPYVEMGPFY
ncbi:MAG: NAD(P)-dependent oxidoreductase [Burkholderiales bacterium]|nr:NAD(P)-dependent oxidoreductase [Burkholderiales bacterium]